MKILKKIAILILILMVLQTVSSTLSTEINVQSSFVKDELIKFDYSITSTEKISIGYTPYVDCPNAIHPLLDYRIASLEKNIAYTGSYEYIKVTEEIEPQTCTAYIEIKTPINQKFEKNFTIRTIPSIDFRALTCKDISCETESKIFVKGENIYFSYISEPGIVTVQGSLKYPDGSVKKVNLPTQIKAEQIGTYELNVNASKEGYKTTSKTVQFGVIGEHAKIGLEKEGKPINYLLYFIIAAGIILIALVFFIIFRIKKRRENL